MLEGIGGDLALIKDRLGSANDHADGGTGLTGEVLRLKAQVEGLLKLKYMGAGIVASVTLFGALLFLGVKSFIQTVANG